MCLCSNRFGAQAVSAHDFFGQDQLRLHDSSQAMTRHLRPRSINQAGSPCTQYMHAYPETSCSLWACSTSLHFMLACQGAGWSSHKLLADKLLQGQHCYYGIVILDD